MGGADQALRDKPPSGRNRPKASRLFSLLTILLVAAGGLAHGNAPIDIETSQATVGPGDRIMVGDLVYAVTETTTIGKDQISRAGDLLVCRP